jgi:hypothetical protein
MVVPLYLGDFALNSIHLELLTLTIVAWKTLSRQVIPMYTLPPTLTTCTTCLHP